MHFVLTLLILNWIEIVFMSHWINSKGLNPQIQGLGWIQLESMFSNRIRDLRKKVSFILQPINQNISITSKMNVKKLEIQTRIIV